MKQTAGYVNVFIGLWFSLGIAIMASLATFTQTHNKKFHNTKEAIRESIKDGIWFFIVAFIFLLFIILLIQRML